MQIYAAIDIKDGKCVRLKQGKFDDVTVYEQNPVKAAQNWIQKGASYLHIVDLDGAKQGTFSGRYTKKIVKRRISCNIGYSCRKTAFACKTGSRKIWSR